MDEGHALIVGTTMSGKTTLGKILAAKYREEGIKNLVLDPFNDPGWQADWGTTSPDEFIATARSPETRECALHLDESGMTVGRFNPAMEWCATQSRHHGHKAHFYTQAPQQLSPIIRGQCSQAFIFSIGEDAAKLLAREFPLLKAHVDSIQRLQKGEFFYVGRFNAAIRAEVDFDTGRIVSRRVAS